ncbi:MAG: OmpA family protein [Actinomycetota bacterium]|nr:OmpA family protein [Actinomycetota bacterium]
MRAALVAVLTLLLLTGCGASGGSRDAATTAPSVPATTTSTAAPGPPVGAMSIVRTANGFTVTGEVPDQALKASLPDTLRQALPGAKIVDDLTVKPGVTAPEFAGLGALFGAVVDVEGFAVHLADGTATLTGTTASADAKSAMETAVKATWPGVVVVDQIAAGPGSGPVPADCATSRADVAGLLKTPITFATDRSVLAPAARGLVTQIADRVKGCQGVKLAVVGYTDDTGGDAINVPLSASRAKSVADELISCGVAAAEVTARGAGAANPVAGNDTAQGRAQNRRVEISVG